MEQFNILNLPDQTELVLHKGIFLSHYREDGLLIDIYQLQDFFIEMSYFNFNQMACIRAFTDAGEK